MISKTRTLSSIAPSVLKQIARRSHRVLYSLFSLEALQVSCFHTLSICSGHSRNWLKVLVRESVGRQSAQKMNLSHLTETCTPIKPPQIQGRNLLTAMSNPGLYCTP